MDGYWKGAAEAFLQRIEKNSSSLDPQYALLEPLLAADQPLTELAAVALWVATVTKDTDSRTAAIDAWATLVADGRGNPALLGKVLVQLNEGGWLRLNRIADALREVSRISPLHAWTASEVLQDFLASQTVLPRDAHHILQLLRELLVQLGLAARPELRTVLAAKQGSDKTSKLARQITALEKTDCGDRRNAELQLLDARLERAKRWAGDTE